MYNNTQKVVLEMKTFVGIDIKNIYIIVHKNEDKLFKFQCPSRKWDGFVLITSGEGEVITHEGEVQTVKKNDLILFRKGHKYSFYFEDECSYITSAYDITFDNKVEFPYPIPSIITLSENSAKKIHNMCDIWQSRKWDSYSICRIKLIETYLDIMKKAYLASHYDRDITKAVSYIHDNFRNNFSGDEIAHFCSISKSYLRTKFLKQTGLTITEYRDKLRINASIEMLESQHFSITEIASELGYYDIYHFSKTFKRIKGISPQKYARQ